MQLPQPNSRQLRRPRIIINNLPKIKKLKDLIEAGKTFKLYKNVDSFMLWRLSPILQQLDSLVGMENVKKSIFQQILYYLQGMHLRNKNNEYLHTIITGLPGTGKTTVAKIIANIYITIGILSHNGPFKIAHRDDFIAGYLGQTSIKTKTLLESCLGGVLFIDEVYSLSSKKNNDSFSKEAIDTLCSFLSENKSNFCCIAAGYENDINDCFFSMNKGLRRRFPWVHHIENYKPLELAYIFKKMVSDINWDLAINIDDISSIIDKNKEYFQYNGGDIENFLTKCKIVHSSRIISLDPEHKFVLVKKDLNNAIELIKSLNKNVVHDSPPSNMYC